MRRTLAALAILAQTTLLPGQGFPDCDDLAITAVEEISGTELAVTLHNSCTDCITGVAGCVYNELVAIRTAAPYDTIARTGCWCEIPPLNQDVRTYHLTLEPGGLPPLDELRFSMEPADCGCRALALSPGMGIREPIAYRAVRIFPNPVTNAFRIAGPEASLAVLKDAQGRAIRTWRPRRNDLIELAPLPAGAYLLSLLGQDGRLLGTGCLLKQ